MEGIIKEERMALYICKKAYKVPAEGKINPAEDTEHWGLYLPPGDRGERGASLWTAAKFALNASNNELAALARSEIFPAEGAPRISDIVCGMTSAEGTTLAIGTIDLVDDAGQYIITTKTTQELKGAKGDKGDVGPGIITVTNVTQTSDTSYNTSDTFPTEVVKGSKILVSSGSEALIGAILEVTARHGDSGITANRVGNIRGAKGSTGSQGPAGNSKIKTFPHNSISMTSIVGAAGGVARGEWTHITIIHNGNSGHISITGGFNSSAIWCNIFAYYNGSGFDGTCIRVGTDGAIYKEPFTNENLTFSTSGGGELLITCINNS